DDKSFAILFEMNEVYERYISNLLSIHLEDYIVHSQHTKYKLLRNEKTSKNIFSLKPDIVIEHNKKYKILIDTKWKKIDSNTIRHGVKREDFYQMYAYLTKYEDANAAILLYPSNENIHNDYEYLESWSLEDEQSKKIRVYNISLDNEEKTVKKLRNIIQSNLN
ncbi:5-methylcytosine restriction system specificity protein McrC, partial [Romboutsia ilealis]